MEKAWIKNYHTGTNPTINSDQFSSLIDLFDQSIENYADQEAYRNFGASLSYAQVANYSRDFAAFLQNTLSINKGDRVALMCPNTLGFAASLWGIVRTGAVQVNVNPLYTPHELAHQLNDADVETIVIFAASTPVLAEIIHTTKVKHVVVVQLDDLIDNPQIADALPKPPIDERLTSTIKFSDAINKGSKLEFNAPDIQQDDLIFLQYTGGTTGLSKGAMLSHGNIIANILQYEEMAKHIIAKGKDLVITAIPMYHIFALSVNTISYFYFGAKNLLITNPRDMPAFVATWQKVKANFITGVNTLFNGLVHTPGFEKIDFSELKLTVGGGAPVQQAVSDQWKKITGRGIKEGYGLSETSPVLTLNLGDDENYVSGIGIPIPSTDISIRDENENEVPQGESGELCAKGPQVMRGYWRNDEATKAAMTHDGYFKTGDIALMDNQGYFHIVDRKKDMILVSGFNVYPNEIEEEVAKLSGVLECACIGVDDEKSGEAPKLFVVKQDKNLTKQAVREHCVANLTGYKVPKHIEFIDEIPKSTVGKLLRRELRNL